MVIPFTSELLFFMKHISCSDTISELICMIELFSSMCLLNTQILVFFLIGCYFSVRNVRFFPKFFNAFLMWGKDFPNVQVCLFNNVQIILFQKIKSIKKFWYWNLPPSFRVFQSNHFWHVQWWYSLIWQKWNIFIFIIHLIFSTFKIYQWYIILQ